MGQQLYQNQHDPRLQLHIGSSESIQVVRTSGWDHEVWKKESDKARDALSQLQIQNKPVCSLSVRDLFALPASDNFRFYAANAREEAVYV